MHLKITFKGKNAQDLSYMLHKDPQIVYSETIGYGKVTLFFPEYSPTKASCVIALDRKFDST